MDMAAQSTSQDVRTMLQEAIAALQAASATARDTTRKIAEQATHPALKAALEQGSDYSEKWRERLSQAGTSTSGGGNPIIDAIQRVGGKIIQQATDPVARDLGIIAGGQLALHYYIAAFGTMAAYATLLDQPEVAQAIHQCLQEAKQGDQRYTELAATIAG